MMRGMTWYKLTGVTSTNWWVLMEMSAATQSSLRRRRSLGATSAASSCSVTSPGATVCIMYPRCHDMYHIPQVPRCVSYIPCDIPRCHGMYHIPQVPRYVSYTAGATVCIIYPVTFAGATVCIIYPVTSPGATVCIIYPRFHGMYHIPQVPRCVSYTL